MLPISQTVVSQAPMPQASMSLADGSPTDFLSLPVRHHLSLAGRFVSDSLTNIKPLSSQCVASTIGTLRSVCLWSFCHQPGRHRLPARPLGSNGKSRRKTLIRIQKRKSREFQSFRISALVTARASREREREREGNRFRILNFIRGVFIGNKFAFKSSFLFTLQQEGAVQT